MTKPTGRPRGRPPKPKGPKPPPKPRGRPPGSKNKPSSIAAFIADALENPVTPPARKPRGAVRGPWATMTPEQRSEYSRQLTAARKTTGKGDTRRGNIGIPSHLSRDQYEALMAQARPEAKRIIKVMQKKGQLPELDPRANEAMTALLVMLRNGATAKDRVAIARTILDFTMSKPTAKVEVTQKTAEELLDDLADEVLGDEPEE